MFETLQDGLMSAIKTLRGKGKLTDANMREGLDMVRQSLLEADVSFPVVKHFIAKISEEALGEKVLKLLDPTEQLIKIVHQELIDLMGPVDHSLHLKKSGLSILMLCGLQGSGKTTTCGKLGKLLTKQGLNPMLVAADLQRPAAIDQLEILGNSIGVPVHVDRVNKDPVQVCQDAAKKAAAVGADVLILDTAGRLHIDDELMKQLKRIDQKLSPDQVYFVVDAMTGQDAVNSAKAFNEALELDGVIMTKLDGDARGGAALSVKHITNVPIKFIGTGEVVDALEEFHPDRMAGRILGMGDVLSLIEQASEKLDKEALEKQQKRLEKGEFTLDDFRNLTAQTKRLGSFSKIMGMIPGFGQFGKMMESAKIDADDEMRRVGGIIDSMTKAERKNPRIIDQTRRQRIATGAGVPPRQVSELVKNFLPMADMMKNFSTMNLRERMAAMQQMQQSLSNPAAGLGGMPQTQKVGTGKRLTSKEKAAAKKKREKEKKRKEKEKRGR